MTIVAVGMAIAKIFSRMINTFVKESKKKIFVGKETGKVKKKRL